MKQAGPRLRKFPEYAVSPDRIVHEARYYRAVERFDRDGVCPRVVHLDADQRVLVLEDLGECERLDAALRLHFEHIFRLPFAPNDFPLSANTCDFGEAAAIAGVEVLRRTLGAARVPEVADERVALEAVRVSAKLLRERPHDHDPALLRGLG